MTLAAMREGALAVTALLRRDLLATSRAGSLRVARAAAMVLSGGAVLTAYVMARPEEGGFAALAALVVTFAMLSLVAAVSAPQAAIQTLRRERDAGMLDLLAMAGVTPVRLASGRILSTFVGLLSLLLATLPALALLAYFGRPTAVELVTAIAVESCAWLALSAFAVAVSAWARSAAAAAVTAVAILIAWSALAVLADLNDLVLTASSLLWRLFGLDPGQVASRIDIGRYLGLHLGIAFVAWRVAIRGIHRESRGVRPPRARASSWRRRLAAAPRLRDAWPLTWLLQRRAVLARPMTLALLLLIPPLAFAWKGERGALVAAWTMAGIALLVAMAVPALHVGVARERAQWDSLMSTSLDGRRVVLDLMRSGLLASAAPMAAAMLGVTIASFAQVPSPLPRMGIACAGLLASWIVMAALGTAGGLLAHGSAGAVRSCGSLLVMVGLTPFLSYECAQLLAHRRLRLPPWMDVVLLAALAGVTLAGLVGTRRARAGTPLFCVPATWSLVILPGFVIANVGEAAPFAAGGLSGLVRITLHATPSPKPPLLQLVHALPHALLAVMLVAALLGRADRWLGRAG